MCIRDRDKTHLQEQAEANGIPLTTYIRAKLKDADFTKEDQTNEFEPQLIFTDTAEYNRAVNTAKRKVKAFNKLLNEASAIIERPTKKKDIERFMDTPMSYVTQWIEQVHRKNINVPISTTKLIELLEIDLRPVQKAIEDFKALKGQLAVKDGKVIPNVNKDRYSYYTANENQNNRLDAVNDLINGYYNTVRAGQGKTDRNGHNQLLTACRGAVSYTHLTLPTNREV